MITLTYPSPFGSFGLLSPLKSTICLSSENIFSYHFFGRVFGRVRPISQTGGAPSRESRKRDNGGLRRLQTLWDVTDGCHGLPGPMRSVSLGSDAPASRGVVPGLRNRSQNTAAQHEGDSLHSTCTVCTNENKGHDCMKNQFTRRVGRCGIARSPGRTW